MATIGYFLNMIGQYEDARDILTYARTQDPPHPDVRGNLGFALFRLGEYEAADKELFQSIINEFAQNDENMSQAKRSV